MTSRTAFRFALSLAIVALCLAPRPAAADTSHARIVRLSLVQGDVRISHNAKGDPLTSSDNNWEGASLNSPVHQGDVLATDHGRAEVEFENGAMAFLAENTVLEFYDLSLDDGSFTTRLILRQGSAEFYAHPGRGDYFSVTGGDFSIEASGKATFRLNNYDDGSDVQVSQGHVTVLSKDNSTQVSKGQSLSMRASDPASLSVDRLADNDEFDQWVSGRIESVVTATTASQQYSNSYNYTSGFGDLYTYGSWFSVPGYGNCWRPYGVSSGWAPFGYGYGHWLFDPSLGGWTFIGGQPWGWLPYHYGGWLFQPGYGWVWNPGGGGSFAFDRGRQWRPVTAVWVHSGGTVGIVPSHPLDGRGKTPINIREGVFPVTQHGVMERVQPSTTENWKNLKNPPRDALRSEVASATPPARVTRTLAGGGFATHTVVAERGSAISFDPAEHRFVNNSPATSSDRVLAHTNSAGGSETEHSGAIPVERGTTATTRGQNGNVVVERTNPAGRDRVAEPRSDRVTVPTPARTSMPPAPRASATPPPAPRVGSSSRGGGSEVSSGGSGSRTGSGSSSSSGNSSRSSSSGSSASSSRSSSSSSSSSSSHPSSSSGGRPH